MNQTTNLIQWKNHTQEVQAEHDFEGYKYEVQAGENLGWMKGSVASAYSDWVYRLVIEPDKWYYCHHEPLGEVHVIQGSKVGPVEDMQILRPAKPNEVPQPKTLEDRIKAKYSGLDVEMLGYCKVNGWLGLGEEDGAREAHIFAQSMKDFQGYVYDFEEGFKTNSTPIWPNTFMQPKAVLFSRGE